MRNLLDSQGMVLDSRISKLIWFIITAMTAVIPSLALADGSTAEFSSVVRIRGTVYAQVGMATPRLLTSGDSIKVGERIISTPDGQAVLQTTEGSILAIRPNAEFIMDAYSSSIPSEDKFLLRIFKGALRLVTGLIGQRSKESVKVVTPTAVIGIRGTDYEPYVMTDAMATVMAQKAGTYNRVYSGATSLNAYGEVLDINAGQVGLAPQAPDSKNRALITALVPVLLEKVPDFYVSGIFDNELAILEHTSLLSQNYSESASRIVLTEFSDVPTFDFDSQPSTPQCNPQLIASEWLDRLDLAIASQNTESFIAQFSSNVQVSLRILTQNGSWNNTEITHDDFYKSTRKSFEQLNQYHSVRLQTRARMVPPHESAPCNKLEIQSTVTESGIHEGRSFRFRSMESYTLELHQGNWLATRATTQRY